ncbi:hypothetical protein [Archangium lipolyticum]|uniref:hypothetical protein n=1 Tax=Archangium lipolyticum TaxID=2970465 RepID=UPI00214A5847|nr:hypothetical protein [Archangium lipolyticum]
MDEKKKSEEKWEEAERLGPYQLHEQVPQSAGNQGELYRATHETSGATALVLKPAAEQGAAPLTDWRVQLSSSASAGYIAMEPRDTPWSVAPDKHSVEALMFLFEGVQAGVGRMSRAFPNTHAPRLRWSLGLSVASAAAVCALLFALVRLSSVSQTSSGPELVASTPSAPVSHEASTAGGNPDQPTYEALVDVVDAGESVLARPLPREPFKGQKRPPCTRYVEVELVGACWLPHELKAPCPDILYEYEGKCYLPAYSAKPPPSSLGQ